MVDSDKTDNVLATVAAVAAVVAAACVLVLVILGGCAIAFGKGSDARVEVFTPVDVVRHPPSLRAAPE